MGLIRMTQTYQDGRTKLRLVAEDTIKDIEPDEREGSPSKSIVLLKDGFRIYAKETVEQLAALL